MGERLVTAHLEAAGGRAEAEAKSVSFFRTVTALVEVSAGETWIRSRQKDDAGYAPGSTAASCVALCGNCDTPQRCAGVSGRALLVRGARPKRAPSSGQSASAS